MTEERIKEILSSEPDKQKAVKEFGEYQGKALQLFNGKYGYYLKWGDKNCAIPKEERADALSISEERAREIASSSPEKSTKPKRRAFTRK